MTADTVSGAGSHERPASRRDGAQLHAPHSALRSVLLACLVLATLPVALRAAPQVAPAPAAAPAAARPVPAWANADAPALLPDAAVALTIGATDRLEALKVPGRVFLLRPAHDGPLTLTLESYDFDPQLLVTDTAGARVAADNNGLLEWNARLVLPARADTEYRVVALAGSRSGEGTLTLREGDLPAPAGTARTVAALAFCQAVAERARARGDDAIVRVSLTGVGRHLHDLRRYAEAIPVLRSVRDDAVQAGDAESECLARSFLGACLHKSSRPADALAELPGALALAQQLKSAPTQVFVLTILGDALLALDRPDEAAARFEELAALAASGGDAAAECTALTRRGRAEAAAGDLPAARASLAAAGERALQSGNAEAAAQVERQLGRALWDAGLAREAVATFERGLAAAPPGEASAALLGSLGRAHLHEGRYAEARRCFREALARARAIADPELEAVALQNLGHVEARLGNQAGALEHAEASLEIYARVGNVRGQCAQLANLASLHRSAGQDAAERAAWEAARDLAESVQAAHLQAIALTSLGNIEQIAGRLAEARALHEQARALCDPETDPVTATFITAGLADLSWLEGRGEEAIALAREAARGFHALGRRDDELDALGTISMAALSGWNRALASEVLAQATALAELPAGVGLDIDEEAGRRSPFTWWGELAQDVTALALLQTQAEGAELDALVAEGFAQAGRWKSRALLEGLVARRDGAGQGPADSGPLAGATPAQLRAALLHEGRVLVEYATGTTRLYAYVLDGQGLRFLDLGLRAALESQAADFTASLADQQHPAAVAQVAEAGQALYARLLAPALSAVKGSVDELLIVPCGSLTALPFEALVVERDAVPRDWSELTFVLDRWAVSYGPSTPVLLELSTLPPRRSADKLLVLADPVYPGELPAARRVTLRSLERYGALPRLPGTRDEALAIAGIVSRHAPGPGAPGGGAAGSESGLQQQLAGIAGQRDVSLLSGPLDLYLGSEVVPARLSGDLREYSILHCASHGLVDPEDPARSGLALSVTGDEPGLLTIADVLELQLDADLTVLSACQTAQGRMLKGEGVQSLARAFLYAGSRSVIATLWPVGDQEAQSVMRLLYERHLEDGLSPERALREAKLSLRRGGQAPGSADGASRGVRLDAPTSARSTHPHAWAPFIHVGKP